MNAASVRRLRTAALRALAPALCVTLLLAGPAARPASAAKLGPTLTARRADPVSLPTSGGALPGPVDGSITQQVYVRPPVADIQGLAATVFPADTVTRSSLAFAIDPYRTAFTAGN